MNLGRRLGLMPQIALCLLLTSCIDSQKPLCDPEDAKADANLTGTWRTKFEDGAVDYYHIALAGGKLPAGVMRIVTVAFDKDGKLSRPGELLAFSADVGDHRFLNVAMIDDQDFDSIETSGWDSALIKGYLIVKYQVDEDKLTVWEIDAQAKRQLIDSKKLAGTIDKTSIFFTDTQENIVAVLSGPDSENLFTKTPTVYERIRD